MYQPHHCAGRGPRPDERDISRDEEEESRDEARRLARSERSLRWAARDGRARRSRATGSGVDQNDQTDCSAGALRLRGAASAEADAKQAMPITASSAA
jgi:hypothetical protein